MVHYASHTLELLLAFPYDWENETILPGALRHFKRYQTCIVTFCTYYIAWILGDEGRGENGDCSRSLVRTVSTGCETPQCAASWMLLLYARDSSRWLLTPGPHFLSRGAQTFWHRARAYSFQQRHLILCSMIYIYMLQNLIGYSKWLIQIILQLEVIFQFSRHYKQCQIFMEYTNAISPIHTYFTRWLIRRSSYDLTRTL